MALLVVRFAPSQKLVLGILLVVAMLYKGLLPWHAISPGRYKLGLLAALVGIVVALDLLETLVLVVDLLPIRPIDKLGKGLPRGD